MKKLLRILAAITAAAALATGIHLSTRDGGRTEENPTCRQPPPESE
jgi:hypothetical protein